MNGAVHTVAINDTWEFLGSFDWVVKTALESQLSAIFELREREGDGYALVKR
jgi:hypothetical protein